jgi:chromosome segregation ATPase
MVASLEKECNELEGEYRYLTEEKRALELVLRTKQASLPKKDLTLEKLKMDTRSLDAQLEDDAKRLEELRYIVIL